MCRDRDNSVSSGERFWDFSLRVYAMDGVSAACLALQERLGIDVNLLLYCCWLGQAGREVDAAGLTRALALSDSWAQQVVRPLRGARSWMKAQSEWREPSVAAEYSALRDAIKAVELQAEHLQQQALESMAGSVSPHASTTDSRLHCTAGNLRHYFADAAIELDAVGEASLGTILAAASGAPLATAQHSLRTGALTPPRPAHD